MRLLAASVIALGLLGGGASCNFDGYCLDCAQPDGGRGGDGGGDGGGPRDAGDGIDACVSSGVEVCDGLDNDCNGMIDDGILPGVGATCSSNVGECVEGTTACVSGKIECRGGGVIERPEVCNGLDDDCDGTSDNDNPGGGVPCGTQTGECVAGTTMCTGGAVQCVGDTGPATEICDGRDNDCDNAVDENTGGGQCGPITDTGLCEFGTRQCIGGQLQCPGAVFPRTEICDALDQDCDGNDTNGFDLGGDVQNCGTCGHSCYADPAPMGQNSAIRQCVGGACRVGLCATGFHNLNGSYADGCEYGPCSIQGSQEACNGVDDDCDSNIDENLGAPPAICIQQGECLGTVAECESTAGYDCNYGPTVSTDVNGDIIPEASCDDLDNDCDGFVDEAFPTKGAPCDDGDLGICRGTGVFVCNGAGTGVVCMITDPGATPGTETCDNTDEDCDGVIDNGDHQVWRNVGGGVEMFAYEASRPDSTSAAQGFETRLPCSKPNALPWTNITHPQAETACAAIGARLCTETEWQATCRVGTSCTWSYGTNCTTYQPSTCNGNDYDTDPGIAGDQDRAIPTAFLGQCTANLGGGVFDMSGNVKEWTAERGADINPIRGGSYNNTPTGISCAFDFLVADDSFFFPNIGFRCCR